jgi:hypothetical protein
MSHDGRVIAKRPGADLSGNGDDEATVWPEMVKNYKLDLSIEVISPISSSDFSPAEFSFV